MDLLGDIIDNKYKISQKIGEGGMSFVWLAEDLENGGNKAIKILKKDSVSARVEDVLRFKKEAINSSKLEIQGIAKTFSIGQYNNLYYIVMEYIEGESLQKYIEKDYAFTLSEIIEIILNLSNILDKVHKANIIHRDIKPENLIIKKVNSSNNKCFETTLIDFGLARLRSFNFENSTELIGSIYYMSPEQTGFLNKSIDERSDLYSLGIVFYQLIANKLPFIGSNISSVLHQHIAKLPPKIEKVKYDIPLLIEKIIYKLLEKEPDNRYQSAYGLIKDLEKCSNGNFNFEIGFNDNMKKLNFKTVLIGHSKEFDNLKLRLNEALNKKGSFCLISGEGGIGKSKLIEELKISANDEEIIFLSGKCLSKVSTIPYDSIIEALNDYIRFFKFQNEDKKINIKNIIHSNINNLGWVMLNFIPQIIDVLGECPSISNLDSIKEVSRFKNVITDFFKGLCEAHKIIVLIIDDMQWIDEGSLTILKELSTNISNKNMLILGTYRTEEVNNDHKLDKFIKNLLKNKYKLFEYNLNPLDKDNTIKLVSLLIHESENKVVEIAEYIFKKSFGNPYLSIEILKQLVEDKILNYYDDTWKFDKNKYSKFNIPNSVIDIILKKIRKLNDKELLLMEYAAVFGKKLDVDFLLKLIDIDSYIIINLIDKAIDMQFLEYENFKKEKILFPHDRVREAFIKYISNDLKIKIHVKIADILEKDNTNNKHDFDLAYHYLSCSNFEKALKYLYSSGIKSKESYGNYESRDYFLKAIEILERDGKIGSALWVEIIEKLAEVYIIIGESKKAIEILEDSIKFKTDNLHIAKTYKLISQAYFKSGDYQNCEKYTKIGMNLIGIDFPIIKLPVIIGVIKESIKHFFHSLIPKSYFLRERVVDEKYKLAAGFLLYTNWAYGLSNVIKFIRTTLQTLNITESKLGKSYEYASALSTYASLLMAIPLFKSSYNYHNYSIQISKNLNNSLGLAQGYLFLGHCLNWQGNYNDGLHYAKKCIKIYEEIGDLTELGMAINLEVQSYYYQGDYTNAKLAIDRLHENSIRANDTYTLIISNIFYIQYYREIGEFSLAQEYGQKTIDYSYKICDWYNYCYVNLEVGMLYLEMNDTNKALNHLEIAKNYYEQYHFLKQYTILVYIFLAEAYILKYSENKITLTKNEKILELNKIKKMCVYALSATKNWVSHYGNALRVMAQYYILIGNLTKAENLFLESIKINEKINRKYELAKAMYQYEPILSIQNRKKESFEFLESSYIIFKSINSKYYKNKLENKLGISKEQTNSKDRFSKDLRYHQRMSSIMAVSQKISSILDLKILLENIIDIIIEVSGAQNGYILIKNEKSGKMEVTIQKEVSENLDIISANIVNEVLETKEAVITTDASFDDKYSSYNSIIVNNLKSILCIPIKYNNDIKGICFLYNKLSGAVFTKDDINVLNSILTQAAISIENAKLFNIAITDGLTGLITHKHFKYILEKEFERSLRYQRNFALIMFDLDHFKSINDTYGHPAGDKVLVSIAEIAKESFRSADVIARYGGEEFAVILSETDINGVTFAAERFREKVFSTDIFYEQQLIKVTISIGIAFQNKKIKTSLDIIKFADKALYDSKKSGRNKITIYKN